MPAELPQGAFRIDVSATYNRHTIPRELRRPSSLPPETWARLVVQQGELLLTVGGGPPVAVRPESEAIVPPQMPFLLADNGQPVLFHLEYFHEPRVTDARELAAQLGGRS
jgi:hypothetical protein